MNGICWAAGLGLFVIVTSAGPTTATRVLTSPDGINWTARTLPVTGIALRSASWSPDLDILVAVGDSNAIFTSPDGSTWTQRTGPATSKNWRFVVWAGGTIQAFCMVAGNGGGANDYAHNSNPTSTAWSQKALTTSAYDWQSIAYSANLDMLAAVGGNTGVVARSTDGANFTQINSGLGTTPFHDVCWADTYWVVVGSSAVRTSPDGITWTAQAAPAIALQRVAARNSAGVEPLELTAALAEDATFDAAITISPPPLELAAAFVDESALAPTIGIWPPLHLAATISEDAAFAAAITILPAPLHLAVDLADGAALAVYLTVGAAALLPAADFVDDAVLTARATLLAALALAVAFTDDAELAAPVTIGFQPHAPPIQVVVVLSW